MSQCTRSPTDCHRGPTRESTQLAKTSENLSFPGYAGTLQYSAPETLKITDDGRQKLSKRVDVWSLGVMLFEMLHQGRTVFERYKRNGQMCLGIAIVTKGAHEQLMKFDFDKFWQAEKNRKKCDRSVEDKIGGGTK